MTMKRLTTSFFTLLLVLSTVLLGPAPVAQAVTPGLLAPLGDQLGDVGQYYSNVGTSFGSKTYIQNTTTSTINATIYLYDDDGGSPVVSYSLDVPALGRVRAEFTATDGQLRLYTDTQNSFDTSATPVGSNLHGIYHMKITGTASGLQVVTRNWRTNASNQAMTDAAGIRGEQAGTALYLPEISIDRNTRWDTEIVVQNVGTASATVKFELHDDNGNYMNGPANNPNNAAVLQPGERRIFLASQLAYAPNNGALIELNGTFGMGLKSTGANVVAYTRVFRHGTDHAEDGALEAFMYTQPQVVNELLAPEFIEGGGNTSRARIMNPSSYSIDVDYWVYDQSGQLYYGLATIPGYGGIYLRSYNVNANFYSALRVKARNNKTIVGAAWTDTWSGHMGDAMMPLASTTAMPYLWKNYSYDGLAQSDMRHLHTTSGNRNYTFYPNVGANNQGAVSANRSSRLTASASALPGSNTIEYWGLFSGTSHATRVDGESLSDHIGYSAAYQPQPSSSTTWYVPFVPAPVVAFEWDSSATDHGNNGTKPGPKYGVALWYDRRDGANAEDWFKDLNWYFWPFLWKSNDRGNATTQCNTDIRYMLMDKGLANYPDTPDQFSKIAFNTTTRMNAIRNLAPSACAGRPLLLANEPDVHSWQAFMTYPELGRQQFVYRAWPGELFSPAFAHATYHDLLINNVGYHPNGVGAPCWLDGGRDGCLGNPYVNLMGLADYYSNGGSFNGLGLDYYGEIDGIAWHNYSRQDSSYLHTYRDIAASHHLKIIVTEYAGGGRTYQEVADDTDDMRGFLVDHLGGYDGNPFKLMWYSQDGYPLAGSRSLVYPGNNDALTSPVGTTWRDEHGAHN